MSTSNASHSSSQRTDGEGSSSYDKSMVRRRNKRRHVSPTAPVPAHLKNPFQIINFAVRYDEAMNDESILQVPLESGSIYNQRLFTKALAHLQNHTKPIVKAQSGKGTVGLAEADELVAITPIILSGLLANLDSSKSAVVLNYCNHTRRAAVSRVQMRKERRRLQRIATPLLICGFMLGFYLYIVSDVQFLVSEYGFNSCEIDTDNNTVAEEGYGMACRLAEASTWMKVNDAQVFQFISGEVDCTVEACPLVKSFDERIPIYSMHAQLEDSIIPLEDVLGKQRRAKRKKRQQRSSDRNDSDNKAQQFESFGSVQWLGETFVNRLVRETILAAYKLYKNGRPGFLPGNSLNILDVGAGLSATLFSLSTLPFQWAYHGISISEPEVRLAKQLIEMHGLSSVQQRTRLVDLTVEQKSFDRPLPPKSFHVMVAIESLSYSQNLTKTLINLAAALKPKGTLIVVDDVLAPWVASKDVDLTASKPSLITHQEWIESFESAKLTLQEPPRDLGLEYEISSLEPEHSNSNLAHTILKPWFKWYGGVGSEDLISLSRANVIRHTLHSQGDLSYMIFVVSK